MTQDFRAQFTDYLEQKLSGVERESFEQALSNDPVLQADFDAFCAVVQTEADIRNEQHSIHDNFTVKVMQAIEEDSSGFFRSKTMEKILNPKILTSLVGTFAALVIVVKLSWNSMQNMPADTTLFERAPSSVVVPEAEYVPKKDIQKSVQGNETQHLIQQDIATGTLREKRKSTARVQIPRDAELDDTAVGATMDSIVVPRSLESKQERTEELYRNEPGRQDVPALSGGRTPLLAKKPSPAQLDEDVIHQHYSLPPIPLRPSESNTEVYAEIVENSRQRTIEQPVSTFSIDVDTGSYTNARRFLTQGLVPPKDAVRIEEFLNYFDYQYPVQHEQPFTLSYEVGPMPKSNGRYLLKLGIKAKDIIDERKPWNLVFLIDVSGSMSSPNKLELVKRALNILAGKLGAQDRISIVTYAGSAGTVLEPTPGNEHSKILSALSGLQSGGSTHGSAGIVKAYELAQQSFIEGGVNRVVLATDGDFNVGTTSDRALISLIEEKRNSGVTLTTLGVGEGNIKEAKMEQLANKGNGNYFYIDSFKEARKVFETQLAGTVEVVAKDVKLQMEFNPAAVVEYRLVGYENRTLRREDFNNDKIDAGEIGAGHTVTALYEIVLAGSEGEKNASAPLRYADEEKATELANTHPEELGFLKIRYKEPQGSTSKLLSFPIKKADIRESFTEMSEDYRFATAVSMLGHILRQSSFVGDYTLDDVVSIAGDALGKDEHGYRREFVELVKNARAAQGR